MSAATSHTGPAHEAIGRGASPHTPTVGSLLRSELLRIRSRRFARWMVVALLAIIALTFFLAFRNTAAPSAAAIEKARALCLQQLGLDGSGSAVPAECSTVQQLVKSGAFDKDPAIPADLADGVIGVAGAIAVVGFIFGCTLGGADWANRTMPALLFWEPRRVRLFLVKMVAFALSLVALLLAAVALWTLLYCVLIAFNGTWHDGSGGATHLLALGGQNLVRGGVLVASAGLLGFGLANITRNTGAALGVAFVTFAILDTFIRVFLWWFVQWQFTTNVAALLAVGGLDVNVGDTHPVVHISVLRAGLVLVAYVVVVCGAALELFRRRDVT